MSKLEKSLLTIGIICVVSLAILITGLISMSKHNNQTNCENPPEIKIVEQSTKRYILNHWEKSNVSLIFIRREKISNTCVVYYFELEEGLYLDKYDVHKTYYIKTVYNYWIFKRVLRSNYSEAVEVNNNENN